MGYLNNTVITVDAILTKKGRELLARGDGSFSITQFALSDDEIDYTIFNTKTKQWVALKVLKKESVAAMKHVDHIINERNVLKMLSDIQEDVKNSEDATDMTNQQQLAHNSLNLTGRVQG